MPAPPPALTPNDESELSLLSVLFFVYAAFVGMIALVVGGLAFLPPLLMNASRKPVPHEGWIVGGVFTALFIALALFLTMKAIVLVMAGRAFARRTGYVLCMVGACMSLMNIPLGTALGIFAIVVLQRPAVKARFGYLA